MRIIILTILFISLPLLATASDSSYGLQIHSKQISNAEHFWSSFWQILQGKQKISTADLNIRIINAQTKNPIRGATVMVGSKKGDPFANNTATTDNNGNVSFNDPSLQTGTTLPITASKRGFANITFIGNLNNSVEIEILPSVDENDHAFFEGKLLGLPSGLPSNILELALFTPALSPASLLNFDIQQIISSYPVEMDLYGKREIPGNIVFPPQSKRYGLIPISLNKPEFIMPLSNGLRAHMAGIAGNISIGDAMDAIKAKDYLSILNLTKFTNLGWSNRITVERNEKFNINTSYSLEEKAIRAELSGIDKKLDAVSLSAVDPESDKEDFVTMDIKALKSENIKNGAGTIKLATLSQKGARDSLYVFTALFDRNQLIPSADDKTEKAIVGAFQKVNTSKKVIFNKFLKPIKSINISSNKREYKFTSPNNNGINTNLMILNIVSLKKNTSTKGQTKNILWSTIINGSLNQISLPDLGVPVLPSPDTSKEEVFQWELLAISSTPQSNQEFDAQMDIKNFEHVSGLIKKF